MKKRRFSTQQLLAFILLAAFAAPAVFYVVRLFDFGKADREEEARNAIAQYSQTAPAASEFVKEGELQLLSAKGDTIRKIDIELATNDTERAKGLMFRQSMTDGQGMLFIQDKEEPQSFWMKNTYISLDILYINQQNQIIKIAKMAQPHSEVSIPSEKPAIYVLEVNGGFCDKYGVKEGDKIMWKSLVSQ